jgi:hypothetical protein
MVFNFPADFNSLFDDPDLILLSVSVFIDILVLYLLYRFIAGFLVPLFRTTNSMRQQFRNMSANPPADGPAPNPPNPGAQPNHQPDNPKSGAGKVGEYIDFEEIT